MAIRAVQYYETSVADRNSGLVSQFIVLPRTYLNATSYPSYQIQSLHSIATLDLAMEAYEPISPALLPLALGASLSEDWTNREDVQTLFRRSLVQSDAPVQTAEERIDPNALELGRYLFNEPVVPVEQSPLSKESLSSLVTTTGGSVGVAIGWVAGGDSPLVLLTVPAGMILIGAASGVASALTEGLQTRLLSLMGVPERAKSKTDTKS